MVNVILCGHGNFASGIYSSIKLIAGEQENFEIVDFTEDISTEELNEKISNAVENLRKPIAILTDLVGGSPFHQAALIAAQTSNVQVVGGLNLPMALTACFYRRMPLEKFIEKVVADGKVGIEKYELKENQGDESNENNDSNNSDNNRENSLFSEGKEENEENLHDDEEYITRSYLESYLEKYTGGEEEGI